MSSSFSAFLLSPSTDPLGMTEVERERDAAVEDTLFFTGGGMGSLLVLGGTRGGVAVPSVVFAFDFVADFDFAFRVELVTLDLAG